MPEQQHTNGTVAKSIAGASTMIAFVLLLFTMTGPSNAKVDVLTSMFGSLTQKAEENAYWKGRVDQQISDLRTLTTKLDVDLQREMRDVNATTEAKLVALDQRLQAELSNTTRLLQATVEHTQKSLEQNSENQINNREHISTLYERLKALQK
jgi:hypothetical protein